MPKAENNHKKHLPNATHDIPPDAVTTEKQLWVNWTNTHRSMKRCLASDHHCSNEKTSLGQNRWSPGTAPMLSTTRETKQTNYETQLQQLMTLLHKNTPLVDDKMRTASA